MTTKQITQRIEMIRAMAGDYEAAHSEEDRLREDFIRYIAALPDFGTLTKKAALILSTKEIPFTRHCA